MSSALFAPVCAVAPTRRRRFLWAAWWTAPPARAPFRKPDAFEGGARTRQEALEAAERAAGCKLLEIEGGWARAWANVLVGKDPWPSQRASSADTNDAARPVKSTHAPSVWDTLGLKPRATVAEIKRAYRLRALETHPDRGGSAEAFRALQSAYESALKRSTEQKHQAKPR
ncbi:MAG: J domain-containing protein [Polyangiaceae bacterium]